MSRYDNFSYGWDIKVKHDTHIDESEGGQDWADEKNWYHLLSLPLHYIDDRNKYADYINLSKIIGIGKNVLLVLFPESDDVNEIYTTFYGRFLDTPELRGERSFSRAKLVFKEAV